MKKLLSEIVEISQQAGKEILRFYDDEINVEQKKDDSPLTKADLAAHHVIIAALKKLTPEIPIISEEGGIAEAEERKNWNRFWLVDPLDGTKEFIKKNGEFTVNIALIENDMPVLGVVHIPVKEITYTGVKNDGAYKTGPEGETDQIFSKKPDLNKPLTIVHSRSHASMDLDDKLAEHGITIGEKIVAGSSLKFCLVAEGVADIYPRMGPTSEWDTAAGDAVFRYSGNGDARYSPLSYNKHDLRNPGFIIGLK
jgi:3'(2'), 5'-bisphosphate nucleotidase